jgi:hypothetical protein
MGVVAVFSQGAGAQSPAPKSVGPAPAPAIVRWIDANTGLELRLRQISPREVVVEVSDIDVSIRKSITPTKTVTTMTTGGDEVSVTVGAGGFEIRENQGAPLSASAERTAIDRMAQVLERSPAATAAHRLLARLDLTPSTFGRHELLLTQALLELGSANETAVSKGLQWSQEQASRPKLVKAAFVSSGPGECWDEYSADVMQIYADFSTCEAGCKWYMVGCDTLCSAAWLIRVELAFDWLLACSGGLPVR